MSQVCKQKSRQIKLSPKVSFSPPLKVGEYSRSISRKYQQLTPMPIPTFLNEKKSQQIILSERESIKNRELLNVKNNVKSSNDNYKNELVNGFVSKIKGRKNEYKKGEMEVFGDIVSYSKQISQDIDEKNNRRKRISFSKKKQDCSVQIQIPIYPNYQINSILPCQPVSGRSQVSSSVSPVSRYKRSNTKQAQDHNNYLNKYEIERELGKGTYGVVYLARQKQRKQNVNKKDENKYEILDKFKTVIQQQEQNLKESKQRYLSTRLSSLNSFTQDDVKKMGKQSKEQENENRKEIVPVQVMRARIKYHQKKMNIQSQLQNRQSQELEQDDGRRSKLSVKRILHNNERKKHVESKKMQKDRKQKEREKRSLTLQNSRLLSQIKPQKFQSNQKVHRTFQNSITAQTMQSQQLSREVFQRSENKYAIKVYEKFKMNKDPAKFKNIRKQITIMQNISHENIIKLYETVQSLTKISLVLQYGGSQSLLDYLKIHYPLNESAMKKIGSQLISAIIYLHQRNIVHRDIKLQNILMGLNDEIKLIDFGFASLTFRGRKLNAICGTPNYMAPQVLSKKQYDGEKSDVWSYGVVMYTLVQGRHPFKAQNYGELQKLANRGVFDFSRTKNPVHQDFIRKILRVKPEERPKAEQVSRHPWLTQKALQNE